MDTGARARDEGWWFEEPAPEEVDEMVDRIANILVVYGLDTIAELFIPAVAPFGNLASNLGIIFLAPIVPLIGERWFMAMQKKENFTKLMDRIKELKREEKEGKISKFSLIDTIKKFIGIK